MFTNKSAICSASPLRKEERRGGGVYRNLKGRIDMPYYHKLGQIPRKHHIWFHRNGAGPSYKNEGIAYEHVFTTQGFDEAYSIMYPLRPPTRLRNVELIKHWEPKKLTGSPVRL